MTDEIRKHTPPFYTTTIGGSRYALVEAEGILFFNGKVAPEETETCRDALHSAITRLASILRKERLDGAVAVHNVFLRSIDDKDLIEEALREYYGDDLPVINFIQQRPCDKSEPFLFEIFAVKGETRRVRVIRRGIHAVLFDIGSLSYGCFGGFTALPETKLSYDQSRETFEQMRAEMERNGFQVSDLIRTWLYQGSIVQAEGQTQRYKELNRARTDFFEGVRFLQDFIPRGKDGIIYPASTGIGTAGLGICMGGIAVRTENKEEGRLTATPLENPGQTPAFDYGAVYSPQSPKFSRAMAVAAGDFCRIYVSGTASINDSETQFVGDPIGQTRRTIENIVALVSESNLERHGLQGFGAVLNNFVAARVYVKREADYPLIRAICDEAFRGTPVIYTIGDVCRDDLLVEIEGIAACRKA